MTEKEIKREIEKNERRIETIKGKIKDLKFDMETTRMAIAFWKKELEKSKDNG